MISPARKHTFPVLIQLCWVLILCVVSGSTPAEEPAHPVLKVAFVYEHPVNAGGWSQSHEQARVELQKRFGDSISTIAVEGVVPGPDTVRVLTKLARDKQDMIFATSFGHMNPVIKVARQFPDIAFEHASGYKQARNVGTYQIRAYQGRYLAGRIAGAMTATNQIGYVGAFPIPEVIRGINAFTLGVRSVNPAARVNLIWINTWLDPSREREAAELLIADNADIITHHTETAAVVIAAEAAGVYAIGYQFDRSTFGPKSHLLTVEHNWLPIYVEKVQSRLDGNWASSNLWPGLAEDTTRLVGLSPDIEPDVLEDVATTRAEIIAGERRVFSGSLRDNEGVERLAAGEVLSDAEIVQMEWLVEGVGTAN